MMGKLTRMIKPGLVVGACAWMLSLIALVTFGNWPVALAVAGLGIVLGVISIQLHRITPSVLSGWRKLQAIDAAQDVLAESVAACQANVARLGTDIKDMAAAARAVPAVAKPSAGSIQTDTLVVRLCAAAAGLSDWMIALGSLIAATPGEHALFITDDDRVAHLRQGLHVLGDDDTCTIVAAGTATIDDIDDADVIVIDATTASCARTLVATIGAKKLGFVLRGKKLFAVADTPLKSHAGNTPCATRDGQDDDGMPAAQAPVTSVISWLGHRIGLGAGVNECASGLYRVDLFFTRA